MIDRPALNEHEAKARIAIVTLSTAMLAGTVSYFEGASALLRFRHAIGGIGDHDQDFGAFFAIQSKTDHLPLSAQCHLWNPEALARLSSEFQEVEQWAAGFAPEACKNLIARFSDVADTSE